MPPGRPLSMRDTASSTRNHSSARYGPSPGLSPSSSSSGLYYGGAPPTANGLHNVHVPDVVLRPPPSQGQPDPLDVVPRSYSPPSTGHDLMWMFPLPPPSDQFSELKAGPTSNFFRSQERAFFAQASLTGRKQIHSRTDANSVHRHRPLSLPPMTGASVPVGIPARKQLPQPTLAYSRPHIRHQALRPSPYPRVSHVYTLSTDIPAPVQEKDQDDDDDDDSWRFSTAHGRHTKRTPQW